MYRTRVRSDRRSRLSRQPRDGFFGIACLLLVAMNHSLIAQEPVLDAVPQEWISGDKLTVSSLNFSITAPTGWQWGQKSLPDVQGKKVTGFFAVSPDGTLYAVTVWERTSHESLQQADMENFARGMAKSLAAGVTLLDVQVRQSDLPLAGSSGFRTRLRDKGGRDYYLHGYIVRGRWGYNIVTLVPDETKPAAFSSFARSLRFLASTGNEIWRQGPPFAPDLAINDEAGILSIEQRVELAQTLSEHNRKGPGVISLLITTKLPPGESIEDLALRRINDQATGENADRVLLAIAIEDRKLRIEVAGDSARARLSEENCKRAIDIIVPQFSQVQYFIGIRAGIRELINQLER